MLAAILARRISKSPSPARTAHWRLTGDGELVALPQFTGEPEQLWRIEQLPDGTWRFVPKSVPNAREAFALSAIGSSFTTFSDFNPASDKQRWLFKAP